MLLFSLRHRKIRVPLTDTHDVVVLCLCVCLRCLCVCIGCGLVCEKSGVILCECVSGVVLCVYRPPDTLQWRRLKEHQNCLLCISRQYRVCLESERIGRENKKCPHTPHTTQHTTQSDGERAKNEHEGMMSREQRTAHKVERGQRERCEG